MTMPMGNNSQTLAIRAHLNRCRNELRQFGEPEQLAEFIEGLSQQYLPSDEQLWKEAVRWSPAAAAMPRRIARKDPEWMEEYARNPHHDQDSVHQFAEALLSFHAG